MIRPLVWWSDRIAAWIVTLGGLSTIGAVIGVFVFLGWTVIPLFLPARLTPQAFMRLEESRVAASSTSSQIRVAEEGSSHNQPEQASAPREHPPQFFGDPTQTAGADENFPAAFGVDESGSLLWQASSTGKLTIWELGEGKRVWEESLGEGFTPRCVSVDARRQTFVLGTEDGKLIPGSFSILIKEVSSHDLPFEMNLEATRESHGTRQTIIFHESGAWWTISPGHWRNLRVTQTLEDPVPLGDSPVVLVDSSLRGETRLLAALTQDGVLHVGTAEKKLNFLTGEETITFSGGTLDLRAEMGGKFPRYLCISGVGDSTYLLWEDGNLLRIDTRVSEAPQLSEKTRVTHPPDTVTAFDQLIGKNTLLVGTRAGEITAWFPIKPETASTPDGVELVCGHVFRNRTSAVTQFGPSQRSRLFAVGYEDGTVRIFHATSEQLVAEESAFSDALPPSNSSGTDALFSLDSRSVLSRSQLAAIAISPKEDTLVAVGKGWARTWRLSAPHAGITLRSIFGRVWYESYLKPEFVWQSSSGTDDFEPKYSLTPLIFGTFKATVFALLFAVPLALLAALYTSEVLHRSVRAYVKPSLELMAGLPSVVLGFLAALVFAPWVETRLSQILALFYTIPFALLAGGHLARLLPLTWQLFVTRYRLGAILLGCLVGILLARDVGPLAEQIFFHGNLKAWLNNRVGTGTPGWAFAVLPLMGLGVGAAQIVWVEPGLERLWPARSRFFWAWIKLISFLVGTALALGLSLLLGWILSEGLGLDPRGLFLGTYVQRNAFVVGLVMGFAIIPIIYTIADDALTAVPDHLRAASLASGATPWQTAVRVVIPTAMSGLFSALMIGLGRAAGETMIVLMAAGNTPIMEWNIFSGFRTLSANIAVELPEAVQGSTHYRMLFLAGLCLFVITFVVNTFAEAVRLRFRKKAFQL